jgi:hypothetical protein
MLSRVNFPIYAVAGRPAKLTGHGGSTEGLGGPLTRVERVTISHGSDEPDVVPDLAVETAMVEHEGRSERTLAREALQRWLYDSRDGSPPRSDAALVLRMRARDRERRKLAALAQVTERLIQIDGFPERFQYVEATGRWAAVGRTHALTITITGRGVDADTVTLMPIPDPATDLFRIRA